MTEKSLNRPSWKIRRSVVIGTLFFCAFVILYLIFKGEDTDLNQSIANGVILLAGSVIGAYVFGATWDDMNVMSKLGPKAYMEPQYAVATDAELDLTTPPEKVYA